MRIARSMKLAALFLVTLGAFLASTAIDAHKAITSKFTYNADVYPVFVARCSHCHVGGGVAPMSLVSYEEAFPWAESIPWLTDTTVTP